MPGIGELEDSPETVDSKHISIHRIITGKSVFPKKGKPLTSSTR